MYKMHSQGFYPLDFVAYFRIAIKYLLVLMSVCMGNRTPVNYFPLSFLRHVHSNSTYNL